MNTMNEWNKDKWIFKDIHGYGYPFYHVHPYKQKSVEYLVKNVPKWVSHVIIFGSSVRTSHLFFKDLDFCLIGNGVLTSKEHNEIVLPKVNYDFLTYKNLTDLYESDLNSVRNHILHEGVLVYEKV